MDRKFGAAAPAGLLIQRLPLDDEEQRQEHEQRQQERRRQQQRRQQLQERQEQTLQRQQTEQQAEQQHMVGVTPLTSAVEAQLIAQLVAAMDAGTVREGEVQQWLAQNSGAAFRSAAGSSVSSGADLDVALDLWDRAARSREIRDLEVMLDRHETGACPMDGADWARWQKAMRRAKPEPRKPLWEIVQSSLIAVFSSNLWDILVLLVFGAWLIILPLYLAALHQPLVIPNTLPICCNLSKIGPAQVQPHASAAQLGPAYFESYVARNLAPTYDVPKYLRLLHWFNGKPCQCNYTVPISTQAPTPAPPKQGPAEPTFVKRCGVGCPNCGYESDLCGWTSVSLRGSAMWRWQAIIFDHPDGMSQPEY